MDAAAGIKEIISNQLDITYDALNLTSQLSSLSNWDSLVALRIMLGIENKFGRKLSLHKFIMAVTVNDLVELVS